MGSVDVWISTNSVPLIIFPCPIWMESSPEEDQPCSLADGNAHQVTFSEVSLPRSFAISRNCSRAGSRSSAISKWEWFLTPLFFPGKVECPRISLWNSENPSFKLRLRTFIRRQVRMEPLGKASVVITVPHPGGNGIGVVLIGRATVV